jgi:LAS superfamily LD-carboxypeptidase LdcB
MRQAAAADGVELGIVSAFRSVAYQRSIVARKLAAGRTLAAILRSSAYPGHSEHHTGRAVDIGGGGRPLTGIFALTRQYRWLLSHAREFGFRLSYSRRNPAGVIFEPWHWCYVGPRRTGRPATRFAAARAASVAPAAAAMRASQRAAFSPPEAGGLGLRSRSG